MGTKKILVILPITRDKVGLQNIEREEIHYLYDPNFYYDQICTDFNVKEYVTRAVEYVHEQNIDAVIYSHDMASLIAAKVCELTGLPGPSLDSVFVACHKYYSRQKDFSNLSCQAINVEDFDLNDCDLIFPCYIKAPCLMCSHLHFIAHDKNELIEIVKIMQNELPLWGKMFFDFFKLYISEETYPLAHQPIILIEQLVSDYQQCAIEGWVDSAGRVFIWAISDINYHDNKQRSQNCYSMPSRMSNQNQHELVSLTTQTVISHGLKSGFFNVDMWHWNGLQPAIVVEVNGRAASLYQLMHKECFNADLYSAMINLALGNDLDCYLQSPIAKLAHDSGQHFGGLFFIVTFGKGRADQFLNFEAIAQMKSEKTINAVEMFVEPNTVIRDNGTAGFRMAKFYVFGESYEAINKIADYWRNKVIKNPELTPYRVAFKKVS